jgi:hypothetical protein
MALKQINNMRALRRKHPKCFLVLDFIFWLQTDGKVEIGQLEFGHQNLDTVQSPL